MIAADLRDDLVALSRAIHADPELAYEEHHAAERITALLEKRGHKVERKLGGLATAFRARIGPPGPAVAILAEYDALPEVGHACGHNLITLATVGAFLLAAQDQKKLDVGIEIVGTPAEEKGGGKLDLIDAGVFSGTVAALFAHPSSYPEWSVSERLLGISVKRVTFHGLAAHAAVSPHLGKNALTALIRLFVAVDGWRQHLHADTRVAGIIREGGVASNIIPSIARGEFGIRAADLGQLRTMLDEFAAMAQGAALQTGTTVEIEDGMRIYEPTLPDPVLAELFVDQLREHGIAAAQGVLVHASGDIGNVSQLVPANYIGFPIADREVPGHSHQMREAAATDLAHERALITAEVLGATARRIATDGSVRAKLAKR